MSIESPPDYNIRIRKYVRFILTGNIAGKDPSDATLDFLIPDAVDAVLAGYPCVALNGAVSAATLANPVWKRAFEKGVAAMVVIPFLDTPAGIRFAGNIVSTETAVGDKGSVKRTRKETDPVEASRIVRSMMRSSMLQIACVRAGNAEAVDGAMFGGVSRRRAIGEPQTLPDAALALGNRYRSYWILNLDDGGSIIL